MHVMIYNIWQEIGVNLIVVVVVVVVAVIIKVGLIIRL